MEAERKERETGEKPVKCIVLDAGPLIANEPPISSLLAKSEQLLSPASVLAEIRDPAARARLDTVVLPFLTVRDPSPASVKVVSDFARRTGDLAVLSHADRDVLALAYELECERNGGDWRLRSTPGQKTLNGRPPVEKGDGKKDEGSTDEGDARGEVKEESSTTTNQGDAQSNFTTSSTAKEDEEPRNSGVEPTKSIKESMDSLNLSSHVTGVNGSAPSGPEPESRDQEGSAILTHERQQQQQQQQHHHHQQQQKEEHQTNDASNPSSSPPPSDPSDDDSDGEWVTPSNLSSHVAADSGNIDPDDTSTPSSSTKKKAAAAAAAAAKKPPPILQVATITGDFALQNVLLQMNLNLLSSRLAQVKHARSHVLRCHACFAVSKDLGRQFCARCGQPTLSRVACSVRPDGAGLVLHLARNYTRNSRGDRYSIPKPVAGSASGKNKKGAGGGKGGWGSKLILAEDQKEYARAVRESNGGGRKGKMGLMDEDSLPSILTGKRGPAGPGGRPKIGAGRDVNSKKR